MDILFLFLIWEEMLSVFHYWEWCLLCVCHICPLLCWGRLPLWSLSGLFFFIINLIKSWTLSKAFVCIYRDDPMVFILQFVNTLKNSCITGINLTWSCRMVLLISFLIQFANILLRLSVFIVILTYNFPFCLCYLCIVLEWGWWWPHRMSLGLSLPLKSLAVLWEGWVLSLL